MAWLVDLVVGIFRAVFGEILDHPIEPTKEEVRDVGRAQPDDPDRAFSPDDW